MIKKILTLLLLTGITTVAGAQGIVLSTPEGQVLENGQVIEVAGQPDDEAIKAYLHVKNNADTDMDILVKREVNALPDETENSFCWGICYMPSVDSAIYPVTVLSGETNTDFYGQFNPEGQAGTASISYYFFDTAAPQQGVGIEVHYISETTVSHLQLSTEAEGVLYDGQTILVEGTFEEDDVKAYINVENTGDEALDVKVFRRQNSLVDDTENSFCWGLCYMPQVDTSTVSLTLEPGVVNTDFYGTYTHNQHSGTSSVTYVFYDMNNPQDSASVEVQYKVATNSLEETLAAALQVYPNPANQVLITKLKAIPDADVRVVVIDMLGNLVYESVLAAGTTEKRIVTQSWAPGFYHYQLMLGNRVILQKKIMVTH